MKRYRILGWDYDSRSLLLSQLSEQASMSSLDKENYDKTITSLKFEYGEQNFDQKIQNFKDIGAKPFCVIAYHNNFLHQIRKSFVLGSYYPALTAACALGERILNHLILNLRESYKETATYNTVKKKEAFAKWHIAYSALYEWGILTDKAIESYKKLAIIRNDSIHFKIETETKDREIALKAILLLQTIINEQFSAMGYQKYFILNTPGETYVKKNFEKHPYIKLIYLPNTAHVGPNHRIEFLPEFRAIDIQYPEKEITDEEFVELRKRPAIL
ncbi:MAG: hypothetical protein Q8L81_09095 [Bacteroidota bacterium]|nr:hypothetical protein [Bacteroidota bacterium]